MYAVKLAKSDSKSNNRMKMYAEVSTRREAYKRVRKLLGKKGIVFKFNDGTQRAATYNVFKYMIKRDGQSWIGSKTGAVVIVEKRK